MVLTSAGHYWGGLSLFRDDRRRPFTEADVTEADALAALLGNILRRYQVGSPSQERVESTTPMGGVVCLDADGVIVGMDDDAHTWLASLAQLVGGRGGARGRAPVRPRGRQGGAAHGAG